jgi:elongation factor P
MQVVKYQHSQGAGRQLGSVQLELRDLQNNSKHPLRLRPGDTVDVVRLEERKFDYLYAEGELLHCMHPTNFEQVAVHRSILGPQARFVAEGAQITLEYHDGAPIAASLPPHVTLKVAQAAPSIKGEAVHAQFKRAVLSTGAELQVPPFVTAGDTVVVDTESGKFVRRGS